MLSRAIAGASPFLSTIAACLVLLLVHRLLAWLILYNKTAGKMLKGEKIPLYQNGQIVDQNLKKCFITRDDLISDVRLKANADNFDTIEEIYMENTGELSVVLKNTP